MARKTIRVNWISEIQSHASRRAALMVSLPVFLVWNLTVTTINWLIHLAIVALLGWPFSAAASIRQLVRSYVLRWDHAKPKGEDDWVSRLLDTLEQQA